MITLYVSAALKVIRKFFLKHNKSFRWHLGDYEKHKVCERRNFDFCVCSYGCVVGPAGVWGAA